MTNSHVHRSWWALRTTYGLVPFLAGLDKFFNVLTDWERCLSPAMASLSRMSATALMWSVDVVEMAVGILIWTKWTRIGAYIASGWLLGTALNLMIAGSFFDIAVRDVAMAVGAFTLAQLSELRDPVPQRLTEAATASAIRA